MLLSSIVHITQSIKALRGMNNFPFRWIWKNSTTAISRLLWQTSPLSSLPSVLLGQFVFRRTPCLQWARCWGLWTSWMWLRMWMGLGTGLSFSLVPVLHLARWYVPGKQLFRILVSELEPQMIWRPRDQERCCMFIIPKISLPCLLFYFVLVNLLPYLVKSHNSFSSTLLCMLTTHPRDRRGSTLHLCSLLLSPLSSTDVC